MPSQTSKLLKKKFTEKKIFTEFLKFITEKIYYQNYWKKNSKKIQEGKSKESRIPILKNPEKFENKWIRIGK